MEPRKRPDRNQSWKRQGGGFPQKKNPRKPASDHSSGGKDKGWDGVAGWYDKHVGADGSDYHQNVILPGVLDLLDLSEGESVLDVCCGQGVIVKHLLAAKAERVLGIDASPQLIQAAKNRYGAESRVEFQVQDACGNGDWSAETFDKATCVMAVHDVPDAVALFKNVSKLLKQGGSLSIVMMHPCFRIPKQSHWGWDTDQKIQYRRLDKYGAALDITIQTRPGKNTGQETTFYHRPLAELLTALGKAGLVTDQCTELFSHRRSQSGPFSKAEHKAAEEFPLFLGLHAIKLAF